MTTARFLGYVLACVRDPRDRSVLIDALRASATVDFTSSLGELTTRMESTIAAPNVVLLSAHENDGAMLERLAKRIGAGWPRTAIVVWIDAPQPGVLDLRALTAAGVHKFLVGHGLSNVVIRSTLSDAWRTSAAEQVLRRLSSTIPGELLPFVEVVLENAGEVTTIAALAEASGVHRRTVFNRCARAGGIQPTDLLGWTRMALVAYHLENTACTVETIAIDLGYPSSVTLRNTIKRYTGQRATDLRNAGAFGVTLERLRAALSA